MPKDSAPNQYTISTRRNMRERLYAPFPMLTITCWNVLGRQRCTIRRRDNDLHAIELWRLTRKQVVAHRNDSAQTSLGKDVWADCTRGPTRNIISARRQWCCRRSRPRVQKAGVRRSRHILYWMSSSENTFSMVSSVVKRLIAPVWNCN